MTTRNAYCSFCRKNYRDVGPLVEGPGDIYICGECAALCQGIIRQEHRRRINDAQNPQPWPDADKVRTALDRLGTLNAEVSERLTRAALDHYTSAGDDPPNAVLLIGPARSSRLCAARVLAHALAVPCAEANADLIDGPALALMVFDRLLRACNYVIELAERGIVYVDDLDDPVAQAHIVRLWDQVVRDPIDHRLKIDLGRLLFIGGGTFADCPADTGITKLGQQPAPAISAEALGVVPALARHTRAILRVPPLDETTLARLVPCIDFARLAGSDASGLDG